VRKAETSVREIADQIAALDDEKTVLEAQASRLNPFGLSRSKSCPGTSRFAKSSRVNTANR